MSDSFWAAVAAQRRRSAQQADERFRALSDCAEETLRDVWRQYRRFTQCYIDDLAVLVSRTPSGALRTLLGEILFDELGRGDAANDHVTLYDRFLHTAGAGAVTDVPEATARVLAGLRHATSSRPIEFAIGVRGLGGECECSMYLATMHRHFRAHPAVRERERAIDWTFWDVHLGELDSEHLRRLHASVAQIVDLSPEGSRLIAQGFEYAHSCWTLFWDCVLPGGERLGPA